MNMSDALGQPCCGRQALRHSPKCPARWGFSVDQALRGLTPDRLRHQGVRLIQAAARQAEARRQMGMRPSDASRAVEGQAHQASVPGAAAAQLAGGVPQLRGRPRRQGLHRAVQVLRRGRVRIVLRHRDFLSRALSADRCAAEQRAVQGRLQRAGRAALPRRHPVAAGRRPLQSRSTSRSSAAPPSRRPRTAPPCCSTSSRPSPWS